MIFYKNIVRCFSSYKKTPLTAHKYMKSVTQTALLYRPQKVISLDPHSNLQDRVVQAFFDTSNFRINVTQAAERLTQINSTSTPAHSYYQINLPFAANPFMRHRMTQFSSPHIRVGRLLQLMDYIASNVAYRYCTPEQDKALDPDNLDYMMVTAAVDEIQFYYPIRIEVDCLLSGYVAFVGRSSIEVHIDVMQKFDDVDRLACSANFVMVARNKKTGKAYQVPRLDLQHEKQMFKINYELGQQRQVMRKNDARRALEIAPPTYQQSVIIHKLNQTLKTGTHHMRPIHTTVIKNTMLMHIQDKNLSGKIFGGLILRLGYQLGWLCATKYLKSLPILSLVDQVQFLAPVEVGSYVELQATVGYVTDRFLHVIVTCFNSSLAGNRVQTNLLHITYEHDTEPDQVIRVYPETLAESYSYLQSLRRVRKLTHIADA